MPLTSRTRRGLTKISICLYDFVGKCICDKASCGEISTVSVQQGGRCDVVRTGVFFFFFLALALTGGVDGSSGGLEVIVGEDDADADADADADVGVHFCRFVVLPNSSVRSNFVATTMKELVWVMSHALVRNRHVFGFFFGTASSSPFSPDFSLLDPFLDSIFPILKSSKSSNRRTFEVERCDDGSE